MINIDDALVSLVKWTGSCLFYEKQKKYLNLDGIFQLYTWLK